MRWHGALDFEGLEEANKILISPQTRRLAAGVDVMLISQGPSIEQMRQKDKRRIERMAEMRIGVNDSLKKMREMAAAGDEPRHLCMELIKHR